MKSAPDKATLLELYRRMTLIRLAEQKIVELYPSDKIQSPIHLSIGQEGVSAGVCLALEKTDHLYGTYRGHGPYIAKGGDLRRLFAELYGKDAGCARGKGGSMHLVAPEVGLMGCSAIVASTIPVAVGDALASAMSGRKRIVAALFGDGGIDEGVFYESVNFTVLKNLPVVFVLENNLYAIHSRIEARRKSADLFRVGESLGLSGSRHDGDDAGEVFAAMKRAAAKIRAGGPPVLLEFMTHRWREHVGPGSDWDEAYREPGEERHALAADPLKRARKMLIARKVSPTALEQLEARAASEIAAAVRFAEDAPFPGSERLLADLFA